MDSLSVPVDVVPDAEPLDAHGPPPDAPDVALTDSADGASDGDPVPDGELASVDAPSAPEGIPAPCAPDGGSLFQRAYVDSETGHEHSQLRAIEGDGDGMVGVFQPGLGGGQQPVGIVRIDLNGNLEWPVVEQTLTAAELTDLTALPTGWGVVADSGGLGMRVLTFSHDGALSSDRTYGGPGEAHAMAPVGTGGFVVVGRELQHPQIVQVGSSGSPQWSKTYNMAEGDDAPLTNWMPRDVHDLGFQQGFVVVGHRESNRGFWMRISNDGTVLASALPEATVSTVIQEDDGTFVLLGNEGGAVWMGRVDADGNVLASVSYASLALGNEVHPTVVAAYGDGYAFLGSGGLHVLDAVGAHAWSKVLATPLNDYDLGIDHLGQLWVSGTSQGSGIVDPGLAFAARLDQWGYAECDDSGVCAGVDYMDCKSQTAVTQCELPACHPADGCVGVSAPDATPCSGGTCAGGACDYEFEIIAVDGGLRHTCALRNDGSVWCWGSDEFLQLGDGPAYADWPSARAVVGLQEGVVSLSVGAKHACAVKDDDTAWCWGLKSPSGVFGSAGTGQVQVAELSGFGETSTIAAGHESFTCAVAPGGTVSCGGTNGSGQLGQGTDSGSASPVALEGLPAASQLALGAGFACAVTAVAGQVYCWGAGSSGQLGDGAGTSTMEPGGPVTDYLGTPLSGVTAIAAGTEHACALLGDGRALCWGKQSAVGGSTTTDTPTAVPVADVFGLEPTFDEIAAGSSHTCALTDDGAVMCWGLNESGQLGDGSLVASEYAALGPELPSVSGLGAGSSHTCAILGDGSVTCWGDNSGGQLGYGVFGGDHQVPTIVDGLPPAAQIAAGAGFTCARLDDGTAACWGRGLEGALGLGDSANRATPTLIELTDVELLDLTAGFRHTCAVDADGGTWCWGTNAYDGDASIGAGTVLTPQAIEGVPPLETVSAGSNATCGVASEGALWCWGHASSSPPSPLQIVEPGPITQVDLGGEGSHFACAVRVDGGVWCGGANAEGQVGIGSSSNDEPWQPLDLSDVEQVACGSTHACARGSAGSTCWGAADLLGALDVSDPLLPTSVSAPGPFTAVSAGSTASCATYDGTVFCWGGDYHGQLGNGNSGDKTLPFATSMPLAAGAAVSVSVGDHHACAVMAGGAVYCWGNNEFGQIGDGSAWRTEPVQVLGIP